MVIADDNYLHKSVRQPRADVRDGWEPIMPAYDKDALSDEDLKLLVAYIRSLRPGDAKPKDGQFPPPSGAQKEPPPPNT